MEWNNLVNNNCPSCNKKLSFRLRGSKNKIRSRQGRDLKDSDYFFCFKCDFQIKAEKLMMIKNNEIRQSETTIELARALKDCKYL